MKASEFNVRPSSGFGAAFSVYWHYEINHAREIYNNTKEDCDKRLKLIQDTLRIIHDKIEREFTEEVFTQLENELGTIKQIKIGALMFEFVSRDYDDNDGPEVNCECFILNRGSYGVTDETDGEPGIPYDDEYCMNWFIRKSSHDFKKVKEVVREHISKFIVLDGEMLKFANAELTWESIERK